jgi:tetratricopeptide (TPR) repeat protein
LELYEQALPIRREVGDRAGEATTLNNLALVYGAIGQPKRALELYEQALPLRREVGDRAGEVATLINLAYMFQNMQKYDASLEAFEQSITIAREILYPAAEVAGLAGASVLLYQHLNRKQEAVVYMEQAVAILEETGLPQDAAGNTLEELQQYLATMRQGRPIGQTSNSAATMPAEQLRVDVGNTVTVMTTVQERRAEWRGVIARALQDAQQREADWQIEVEFYTAILALLDGQTPVLPADHPYAPALKEIVDGIAAGGAQGDEMGEEDDRVEMTGRGAAELVKLIDAALAELEAGGKADGPERM